MKTKGILLIMSAFSLMISACGGNTSSSLSSSSSVPVSSSTDSSSSTSISSSTSSTTSSSSKEEENPSEGEQKIMNLYHGNYDINDNQIIASSNDTIVLAKKSKLTKGSLTLDITPTVSCDSGIIFCVDRKNKTEFWEENVSYYFYFVSVSGNAHLGKVTNGVWSNLKEAPISSFDKNHTYKLNVSIDNTQEDYTVINCFLDGAEQYSYKDFNKLSGEELGIRLGGKNSKSSYVNLSRTYTPIERKKVGDFYIANGAATYSSATSSYVSMMSSTILYQEEKASNIIIQTSMQQMGILGCNGIIFNLNNAENESFWESEVSYYFFFIDEQGFARLAKVNFGNWSDMVVSGQTVVGWTTTSTHVLKVDKDSETINCYVDGNLILSTSDSEPLDGEYFGLRSGSYGTKYKNFSWEKQQGSTYVDTTTYDVKQGKVVTTDESILITKSNNTLALKKSATFSDGTLNMKVNCNNTGKSGIIFRSNEDGTSYYRFTVNNNIANVSKVANGVVTNLSGDKFITASHRNYSQEDMYVSIDNEDTIRCYLRGILYYVGQDNEMLTGNRYGFISEKPASTFKDVNVVNSAKHDTCDTLIFGHSYMEFWKNYATDLTGYGSLINIGIGGSIAPQWELFVNEILDYNASTLICMLGTNDLLAFEADDIKDSVERTLVNVKTKSTTITSCALISCCRCPAREDYVSTITALNTAFKVLVVDNTWVKYADIDNAFLKNNAPDPTCFVDGLHPTDASYLVIRNAINTAMGK